MRSFPVRCYRRLHQMLFPNRVVMGRLEDVERQLNQLAGEVSKLHTYSVSSVASLKQEQHLLHKLVTSRLEVQMSLLNRQLHSLKQDSYHKGQAVPADAFNGQFSKHKIYADLRNIFDFAAYVETGAFHGKTTRFLANSGKPVYSVELNEEYYRIAQDLLRAVPHVNLALGDSIDFLLKLTRETLTPNETVFFYLDAHWYDHLPLREELAIIAAHHPNAVVMIDDFKIDDDAGYGYDSYDEPNEISLAFLQQELRQNNWQVFFPALPSTQDHMVNDIIKPRGTAVFALDPKIIVALKQIKSLRIWAAD